MLYMAGQISTTHAGHGGRKYNGKWADSGALGSGRQEADIVRLINKKVVEKTGAKDVTDNKGANADEILYNQVVGMNSVGRDWHISHHLNSAGVVATGVEVWYWAGDEPSRKKAEEVSRAISKALGLVNRGPKPTSNFYIHRNSNGRTLLIEWGFINNVSDVNKILNNMDKGVDAMLACFGYKTSSNSTDGSTSSGSTVNKTIDQLAKEVIDGKHGNGDARKKSLGGKYDAVQKRVDEILNPKNKPSKPATPQKPTDWSKAYYTTNPKKVKLKRKEGLFGKDDVNFKGGYVGGTYPAGTVFNIVGIKKMANGLPRLVTESGFLLTANKNLVEQISSNSSSSAPTPIKAGDRVQVKNTATTFQTGERMAPFVKGSHYKVIQVKNVNQSKSKKAYLLSDIMSWVLEQDLVKK